MKSIIEGLRLHMSDITFFLTNSEWFFRDENVCWTTYNLQGKPVYMVIPFNKDFMHMQLEEKVGCYR